MLQPPAVLHSNAPPLGDGASNVQLASRVLQEHPGNRQLDYHASTAYCEKHSAPIQAENSWPRTFGQYPQPLTHAPRYGLAGLGYGYRRQSHWDSAEEVRKKAKALFNRFQKSEQYTKYRARQQKGDKNQEQKWPDNLELAFFQGEPLVTLLRRVSTNIFLPSSRDMAANGPPQVRIQGQATRPERADCRLHPAAHWHKTRPEASLEPYSGIEAIR